jgi:hypothetical protein
MLALFLESKHEKNVLVTQINKQYAKQCSLHLMSALYDNSRK